MFLKFDLLMGRYLSSFCFLVFFLTSIIDSSKKCEIGRLLKCDAEIKDIIRHYIANMSETGRIFRKYISVAPSRKVSNLPPGYLSFIN